MILKVITIVECWKFSLGNFNFFSLAISVTKDLIHKRKIKFFENLLTYYLIVAVSWEVTAMIPSGMEQREIASNSSHLPSECSLAVEKKKNQNHTLWHHTEPQEK